jgi:hypothetical protein
MKLRIIFYVISSWLSLTLGNPGRVSAESFTQTALPPGTAPFFALTPSGVLSADTLKPHTAALISIEPASPSATPIPYPNPVVATSMEDPSSDRLLPDLQVLPPTELRLFYDANSGQSLVRFTNSIWNRGPGKLELVGIPNQAKDKIRVSQRVYSSDPENFDEHEVGEFIFHDQHNHWHLERFASYEVWTIDERGSLGEVVSSGGKVSYCVMDVTLNGKDQPVGIVSPNRSYSHCQGQRQGLSVGWIDTYRYFFPGQFVEVSSLNDGIYALVSTVDPDHLIHEGNIHNNSAAVYFEIRELRLKLVDYLFIEEEGVPVPK